MELLVPVEDFTSNLLPLEATDIAWSIYPQGFIKAILFQIVAVLFQKEQLEIQIPLFQEDFSPAGKLRGRKRKSKFSQLWALLCFINKFLPWVLIIWMFVKFTLKDSSHELKLGISSLDTYFYFVPDSVKKSLSVWQKIRNALSWKSRILWLLILKCWNEMNWLTSTSPDH